MMSTGTSSAGRAVPSKRQLLLAEASAVCNGDMFNMEESSSPRKRRSPRGKQGVSVQGTVHNPHHAVHTFGLRSSTRQNMFTGNMGCTNSTRRASLSSSYLEPSSSCIPIPLQKTRGGDGQTEVFVKVNGLFKTLPTELHQHIATFLASDRDVTNYAAVCRVTYASINESVFRSRFLQVYDDPLDKNATTLYAQYRMRQQFARYFVRFDHGADDIHEPCLNFLRSLILESNAHQITHPDGSKDIIGLNHGALRAYMVDAIAVAQAVDVGNLQYERFLRGTNILDVVNRTQALFPSDTLMRSNRESSLILVIQLCLMHLILDPDVSKTRASCFHVSQRIAYTCPREQPLIKGAGLNIVWLLQIGNFFKFHLKQANGEGIFQHQYAQLSRNERPQAWSGKLKRGIQKLGRHWKGVITYMSEDDVQHVRGPMYPECLVDSTNEGNEGFIDLTLFFDIEDHDKLKFPLGVGGHKRPGPTIKISDVWSNTETTSPPEVKDFFARGYDGLNFYTYGHIQPLPPTQGIPGFQKVTMLQVKPDVDGIHGQGHTVLWWYEGVVLPGNQIMLGRWYSRSRVLPDGGRYCGPFLFWCVDDPTAEQEPEDIQQAVDLMQDVLTGSEVQEWMA